MNIGIIKEPDYVNRVAVMPIINAHEAKNIIVMKRGMGKGYAAIENYLFYDDKTRIIIFAQKVVRNNLIRVPRSI